MSDTLPTVAIRDLQKFYGATHALRGISFSLQPGEIVGLLGPNGAGKSTTMKILTGVLAASAGQASICGLEVGEHSLEARRRIGYLPENVPLYGAMLVWDYLMHVARMRGVPAGELDARVSQAIRDCGLQPMVGRAVEELSKGYQQRVGLAQAIVHDPEVLILDEPTTGLDPNQIVEIRQLIRRIGSRRTVLLSSHILQEIEVLCDRILIIARGQVVADGTVQGLLEAHPACRTLEDLFRHLTADTPPPGHAPAAAASREPEATTPNPAPSPADETRV
jgi:ABC-2 type transport system ATP-binding protein